MFLPNYAFLYLKYMKKSVLHNLCHNSHVPCILHIFVHIVYNTSCTIKWFEWNKLNWIAYRMTDFINHWLIDYRQVINKVDVPLEFLYIHWIRKRHRIVIYNLMLCNFFGKIELCRKRPRSYDWAQWPPSCMEIFIVPKHL